MINKTIKMLLRRTLALAATLLVTNMPLAEEPIVSPVYRFAVFSENYSSGPHGTGPHRVGIAIDTKGQVYAWHSTLETPGRTWCDPHAIVKFEDTNGPIMLATVSKYPSEVANIGKFEKLAKLAIRDDAEPWDGGVLYSADGGYRCYAYFEDVPYSQYRKKRYLLASSGGPYYRPGNDEGKQLVNWLEGIFRKVNPDRLYAPE